VALRWLVSWQAQMLQFAHELQPGSIQIARECWRHVVAAWCRAQKTAVSLVCLDFTTVLKNYSQRVFYMYTKICYASAVAMHMMLWYGI
jgi:hypothetical protein